MMLTNDVLARAVLMGTKSCTKILIFSTRFSCENLAVEDFVTLFIGKKYCGWGNVGNVFKEKSERT